MRNVVLGAALLISGLMGASANAMPLAQPLAPDTTDIQTVDYACGRGYHLSPRGFCRPNGPPRYEREWGVAAIGKRARVAGTPGKAGVARASSVGTRT